MPRVPAGGASIPAVGLGTYPMTGDECRRAVETALSHGYRHVDTAQMYDNEAAVGDAIRASSVPREEVFVVTKIHRSNLARDDVVSSVEASHERLGTTIDLLLIHSPSESVPIPESVSAMNELQDRGLVDHVGVSNFSVDQLATAMEASRTPIVTNQVSYNAYKRREDLLEFCHSADVALTAFSPLAKGTAIADETLADIGDRYDKTAAQIALRWLVQQDGVVAIPKAATAAHQAENLAIFDFELTDDEMARIFDLHGGLTDRVLSLVGIE